jgi:hypothetical protein
MDVDGRDWLPGGLDFCRAHIGLTDDQIEFHTRWAFEEPQQ